MNNIKLDIVPSPYDNRDWTVSNIYSNNLELPETLDYRDQLLLPRQQGRQGSCAAQSAACMKEWQEFIDVGYEGYMSPQFIYNNRENQDSEGMHCRDVMKILSKKGSCFEEKYPYGNIEKPNEIPNDVYIQAKNFTIKHYAKVNTINDLKKALYMNGPCLIAFPTYNYTDRMWIARPDDKSLGGHAMTVVGYNKNGFIIRNSWGINWADRGYCYYSYNDWGSHWEIWTTIDDNSYYEPKEDLFENREEKSIISIYYGVYLKKKYNLSIYLEIDETAENIYFNQKIYNWDAKNKFWLSDNNSKLFITLKIKDNKIRVNEYFNNENIYNISFDLNSDKLNEEYETDSSEYSTDIDENNDFDRNKDIDKNNDFDRNKDIDENNDFDRNKDIDNRSFISKIFDCFKTKK